MAADVRKDLAARQRLHVSLSHVAGDPPRRLQPPIANDIDPTTRTRASSAAGLAGVPGLKVAARGVVQSR
jgi:hypothetical protein